MAPQRAPRCRVLEEDAGLADAIPADERDEAIRRCLAREHEVEPGGWPEVPAHAPGASVVGLLVLDGLLIRRVGIDGRFGAELLGPGDVLRPWQWEHEPATLPLATGWQVLERTRVAVLDEDFMPCLARHPQLVPVLVARALERARNLSVNMAIVHQPRVDVRVHMLLWHLAGRWGVVGRDGVTLRLRLTHAILADLAAARRPTVSSALAELARAGVVRQLDGAWLLTGGPPGELLELAPPGQSLHAAQESGSGGAEVADVRGAGGEPARGS
jgi:hypothetical protein